MYIYEYTSRSGIYTLYKLFWTRVLQEHKCTGSCTCTCTCTPKCTSKYIHVHMYSFVLEHQFRRLGWNRTQIIPSVQRGCMYLMRSKR